MNLLLHLLFSLVTVITVSNAEIFSYTRDGQYVSLPYKNLTKSNEPWQTISGYVYAMMFMNITGEHNINSGFHQILMSGYEGADVWLEIPRNNIDWYVKLNSTARNSQYPGYNLTRSLDLVYTLENRTSLIQRNAILVTSNKPIQLFGTVSDQGSTEGYLALPLMEESKSFWLPSYKTSSEGVSSFAIVSVLDGACVEGYRVNGTRYNKVFTRSMDKNEVYIESDRDDDYSGLFINSTRPIAVYSGHECAQVPVRTRFCDHLVEQVPPANNLGVYFVVPPIFGRSARVGYEIRIIATESVTEVYIAATNERVFLNRGTFHHSQAQFDTEVATVITCSKPCVVTQYNKGRRADRRDPVFTDPFMMVIPPVSHWDEDITFSTSNYFHRGSVLNFNDWFALVCRTSDRFTMRFDGAQVGGRWINLAEGYSVASFEISPGVHRISSTNRLAKYTGFVYGHSDVEPTAYGYPVAYKLFGNPLKGTWYRNLYNQLNPKAAPKGFAENAGPSTTVSPTPQPNPNRRCTLNNLYSSYLGQGRASYQQFTLVGSVPGGGASCVSGYNSQININIGLLKKVINERICLSMHCNYTKQTFVDDIKVEYVAGSLTLSLTVTLASGYDESVRLSSACKYEIRDFVEQYAKNWKAVVPPPGGCGDITFSRGIVGKLVCSPK